MHIYGPFDHILCTFSSSSSCGSTGSSGAVKHRWGLRGGGFSRLKELCLKLEEVKTAAKYTEIVKEMNVGQRQTSCWRLSPTKSTHNTLIFQLVYHILVFFSHVYATLWFLNDKKCQINNKHRRLENKQTGGACTEIPTVIDIHRLVCRHVLIHSEGEKKNK